MTPTELREQAAEKYRQVYDAKAAGDNETARHRGYEAQRLEKQADAAEKEGNTMTTTPDTDHLARELKLYAQNTYALYEQYQAIERTTDKRIDAGATEEQATAHAIHCLEGWLEKAAHTYGREVGHHAFPRFTMAAKAQAAEEIAEEIVDEYEYRKPYR